MYNTNIHKHHKKMILTCISKRKKRYVTKTSEYIQRGITKCIMILTGSINCTSYLQDNGSNEAGLKLTVYRAAVRHCKETIHTEVLD